MELKPRYKQTEVGVIPEDWDVKKVSDVVIAGPKNGFSGRASADARGTQTLRLTATSSGYLILNDETVKRLDTTIDARSDLFLETGDVLIQRSNTLELVGTTAIFEGPAGTYVYPDLMMRLRFKDQSTARWFWKYANSSKGRQFFQSIAAGSTGSMPKISGAILRGMRIPLPALPERRAITEALNDVEDLISALDQLLAKKHYIKQAAMQQLLTGKQRLPGFDYSGGKFKQTDVGTVPEDWTVKRLEDLASVSAGGTPSRRNTAYWGGDIPWITTSEIDFYTITEAQQFITKEGLDNSAARLCPAGTLLMALYGQGKTRGKIGVLGIAATMNQACAAISLNRNVSPEFVFYYLASKYDEIRKLSNSGSQENLNSQIVKALPVLLPSNPEQCAIAAILSDMDAEIAALEKKRDKTRDLKQAMMQELLTGKTRLVESPQASLIHA